MAGIGPIAVDRTTTASTTDLANAPTLRLFIFRLNLGVGTRGSVGDGGQGAVVVIDPVDRGTGLLDTVDVRRASPVTTPNSYATGRGGEVDEECRRDGRAPVAARSVPAHAE